MVKEGLEDWIVKPGEGGAAKAQVVAAAAPVGASLKIFFIKSAVVFAIVGILGLVLGNAVSSAGSSLERDFHRIRTWPETKVIKYRDNARETMTKLKPIIDELVGPFRQPPQDAPAAQTGPDAPRSGPMPTGRFPRRCATNCWR